MVVSTSVVSVPSVRKSIADLAAEFIAQKCPPAQAWELAGKQYDSESAAIVTFHQQQYSIGVNADGLPCDMSRTSKGVSVPTVTHPTAILVQGSSNKQGTTFGPKLRFYAVKQYATSTAASPAPIDLTAGSSSSTCEPDQTSAWAMAELIASKLDCKLFVREVVIGKDRKETYTAKEYIDRQEWLTIVRDEIRMFFYEVAEARTKTSSKRK